MSAGVPSFATPSPTSAWERPHTIVLDVTTDGDDWTALRAAAAASIELDVDLVVVAPEAEAWQVLRTIAHDAERLRVLAPDASVLNDEADFGSGASERRSAPLSSADIAIATGLQHVSALPDATFIATGSLPALIRQSRRLMRPLPTIKQPALAAVYPTLRPHGAANDPFALLLDVGATGKCSDGDLVRFAAMGSAYARLISANERPRVGLLANSSTAERWPKRLQKAHAWLQQGGFPFDYLGPIRADQVTLGTADVVVTDGFSGDILFRTLEGVASTAERLMAEAQARFRFRLGFSLLGSGLRQIRELTDWQNYGGAPLLGFDRALIVTHQRSTRRALYNSIRLARKIRRLRLQEQLESTLHELATTRPLAPEAG